jgi:sugar lactone lactonase YvrE
MRDVRCLFDGHLTLAESPLWCPRERDLWWVNLVEPAGVFRLHWGHAVPDFWEAPEPVTGIALASGEAVLVAARSGLLRLDPRRGRYDRLRALSFDRPGNRCNEVGVDPAGRFWFSTMDDNLAHPDIDPAAGSLYCMEPDGVIRCAAAGFGIPNTLLWSAAGDRMFFGDTMQGAIYAYDFDSRSGAMGARHVHRGPGNVGGPDGSAIDVDDTLWNARWSAGVLLGIDSDGAAVGTIAVPGGNIASACFAGDDLDVLLVTTGRWGLDPAALAAAPQAGGLFTVEGVGRGSPSPRFAASIDGWKTAD